MKNDFASKLAYAIGKPFASASIFSKESAARVEQKLSSAGIDMISGQGYLAGSLFLSFLLSLFCLFISLQSGLGAAEAAAAFFLSFGFAFGLCLLFPSALSAKHALLVEAELPFVMREFAAYLQIGLPFEKCIAKISKAGYALSPDFAAILREVKAGASMQSALSSFSLRQQSMQAKRFSILLLQAYETGLGPELLKRAAEDLSSLQLSRMREQNGRLSLLSILFIASSAILPAFFCVFAALSPLVSSEALSEGAIWAAFLIAFPAINLLVLLFVSLSLPPAVFFIEGREKRIEELLLHYGLRISHRNFALILAALSISLSLLLLAFSLPHAALFALCLAPAAYSLVSYISEKEIHDAERKLPDVLYSAASMHKFFSAERMLSFFAKGGFGRLSSAFGMALRRQQAGESFAKSLSAAEAHCPSPLVKRALSLLAVSYETGTDMYFALREAAQDVAMFFSLVQERLAMLAIQRYTLLLSAAILVPAILGISLSFLPQLAAFGMQEGSQLAFDSLSLACRAYLLVGAALSSAMLSYSEGQQSKALLYFSAIAPLSQLVFLFLAGT